MKAIITVGLGFGDEGKGACIDFLARTFSAGVVVRYCGGGQAGHNVELPDGRRHTFSQFGAGTLAGARTFLGPRMILHPRTLPPEAEHLVSLGVADPWSLLDVHPDCLVTTSHHVLLNRLREIARGGSRHGSCGLGVGETRRYWLDHGRDALRASDLQHRGELLSKLRLLRDRALLAMQELPYVEPALGALMHELSLHEEADALQRATERMTLRSRWPTTETVLFEGAQGVLLDEWRGFHPHTTWSTVTPLHARELLEEQPATEVRTIGVLRGYSTRHGAGPFPTHCPKLTAAMSDPGNPHNAWQGGMRFGPLDLVLTEYAARVAGVDGLWVNCLDQLDASARLAMRYRDLPPLSVPRTLDEQQRLTEVLEQAKPVFRRAGPDQIVDAVNRIAPVVGVGRGPSWRSREVCQEIFRASAVVGTAAEA